MPSLGAQEIAPGRTAREDSVQFERYDIGERTTRLHAKIAGTNTIVTHSKRSDTTITPVSVSIDAILRRVVAAYSNPSFIVPDARNNTVGTTKTETDLTLANHDASNQEVYLCYAPTSVNAAVYRCNDLSLAPNAALTINDVVGSTFPGFGQKGTRGQLTITPSQNPGTLGITATTVTTITDGANPFNGGTFLYTNPVVSNTPLEKSDLLDTNGPGIIANTLIDANDAANNDQVYLLYATDSPVSARVRLHDSTYTLKGEVTINLNNYQASMTPLNDLFNLPLEANDTIETQVLTGSGAGALLLTTDKQNPTTRAVSHTKLATATDFLQYLPSATTDTDVQWHNLNPGANNITYTLLKNDTDNTNPLFINDPTLVFNLTKSYPNILQTTMGQPSGTTGTIKVTSFNEPYTVTSTTNHPLTKNNVTYGMTGYSLQGIASDKAAIGLSGTPFDAGETITDQEIDQLTENNQYTSTLGLVNDTSDLGSVSATVTGLDDNGNTTGNPYTVTLPTKGSTELHGILTTIAGANASNVHRARIHVNQATSGNGMTPRILPYAKLTDKITDSSTIVTGHPILIAPAAAPTYVLKTDLFVVDQTGALLGTTGVTSDQRLMKILFNSTTITDALLGTYVNDNNNPNYSSLQELINRIKTNFADADYQTVFGDTKTDLTPFFTDTDGDGYCIDILPNHQDWQYDNSTKHPGNNAQGTTRIQWKLTKQ